MATSLIAIDARCRIDDARPAQKQVEGGAHGHARSPLPIAGAFSLQLKYEVYFVFSYTNIRAIDSIKFMQGCASRAPGSDLMAGKRLRKTEPSWPLDQRPGFLIRRLHQIHVALFQKNCAAFEITPLQYSLLSALAQRGTADQTTLAADVALDRTTTTGALKRLQLRRFVERAIHRRIAGRRFAG